MENAVRNMKNGPAVLYVLLCYFQSKAQASSVSSEYELIDLHEHSVDRDAKKPNKPDTPPTPTAKPRIHRKTLTHTTSIFTS